MMAAEFSSITKTKSVRPIWATRSGVISRVRSHASERAPGRRQRAALLPDVRLVLVSEVLQRRPHGRDGGVAERAERLAADVRRNARQQIEIARLPFSGFDLPENLVQPVGAFAAGRALAARLVPIEVQ